MAQQTALSVTATPGRTQTFVPKEIEELASKQIHTRRLLRQVANSPTNY